MENDIIFKIPNYWIYSNNIYNSINSFDKNLLLLFQNSEFEDYIDIINNLSTKDRILYLSFTKTFSHIKNNIINLNKDIFVLDCISIGIFSNINIKQSENVSVLAFTHPKDKWEGLLSDWLEEVPGVKRIVISQDYKIKGKSCVVKGDDWQENISARKNPGHEMNQGLCFQYYNPKILDYISSRI